MANKLIRRGRYETLVIGMTVRYIETIMARGYIAPDKNGFFLDCTIKFLRQISKLSAFDWANNQLDEFIRGAIENARVYIAESFRAEELHPVLVKIDKLVYRDGDTGERMLAYFEETLCWIKKSNAGTNVPFNILTVIIITNFFLERFVSAEYRLSAMKIFGSLPGA